MAERRNISLKRVAFVGSAMPRRCGIATFTANLCDAVRANVPGLDLFQVAVNDAEQGYEYGPGVRFEIPDSDIASYRRAAEFLNINNVGVVCVQHEYGIYGGPAGSHILALVRNLRVPVITTVHTILERPDPAQRKVMNELVRLSDRLVVMSRRGVKLLAEVYGAAESQIVYMPHGVLDMPFVDPNFYKDSLGVEGKTVMLTFGLINTGKGIENAVAALPAILAKHPNVVYMIVGATHPHVLRREGESYRMKLEQLARGADVEEHLIFHNRFVSEEELIEFFGASDFYITPYPHVEQIVSGTLAYALAAGKAIISTPYHYAVELLAEDRGVLVPFGDSQAIADQVTGLLDDETRRHAMRKRAYQHGRDMTWRKVGKMYLDCFESARIHRKARIDVSTRLAAPDRRPRELPPLKLNHLRAITDRTGILQHCIYAVPDFSHGYTTDDNARALILAILLDELADKESHEVKDLMARYMAFLIYAFDHESGRFRNFLAYEKTWHDEKFHDDAHGRALWALGTALGRSSDEAIKGAAADIFRRGLRIACDIKSPRASALILQGIDEYLRAFSGDRDAQHIRETLAKRLLDSYRAVRAPNWLWFEDVLSYGNAKMPHALLVAGQRMGNSELTDIALESLDWLVRVQRPEGAHLVPVGSNGFYRKGGTRARFDQQPIEAYLTVSACLEAHRVTGDPRWYKEAQLAFDWFLGRNDLRLPLYDPSTGGCRDGLHADRINQNQGAESTLMFLLSLGEMRLAENIIQETEQ